MSEAQGLQDQGMKVYQTNHECVCYKYVLCSTYIAIIATPVDLMPQVIVTLFCGVISTNVTGFQKTYHLHIGNT